jgi:hypothetical protein
MNKGYFDPDSYDFNKHWHIGYYKNNHDIESVALERKENGSWDVFFNDFRDDSELMALFGDKVEFKNESFGVFLFNARAEEEVLEKFERWVINVLLPFRENNKQT